MTAGDAAPAAEAEIALLPGTRHLGVAIGLAAVGSHERSFLGGRPRASWRRLAVGLGPCWVGGTSRMRLSAGLGLSAGALEVEGAGFQENRRDVALDVATVGTIRVAWRLPWLAPFVGATGHGRLRKHDLRVEGIEVRDPLPRWEVTFLGGALLGDDR
jgi:hypothetical protein